MISAIKDSSVKRSRKKSFRVTFAPGTKTEEEQINNFVKAVECKGPGIDDLSKMIKCLPSKNTTQQTEKRRDEEAESISNIIVQLRKTLDNMLEKECNVNQINIDNIKIESERRSSNSSLASVDSAIADCSKSNEYYKELKAKDEANCEGNDELDLNVNTDTSTSISSPDTRQKVSDLLKELDNCIEELREDDVYFLEDETCQLLENAVCVKDVFATGILIASFVQTETEVTPLEQQYAVLTDDKIYIFESNKSKSPIKYTFSFSNCKNIEKSVYMNNTLELYGEYKNSFNEKVADKLSLIFSSEEECNIWIKLLLDIIKTSFSPSIPYPKRTVSLNNNVNSEYYDMSADYYNPRQTILSALCVLEGIEKSKSL
ncbi:hypothetical protein BCR32DRAFT_329773 [Anaeromyces robustus]|uniref:PH domain-containing protein n=1 Tax=Anaeromyces robustus TaxID=1754192 RepID=A0A1Y1WPU9_9FUNG|nr:hypothetical protein BCR32DRAFT_329773 [Anaeromyces robustus]|eukprot:ORX75512.1 hypothetical protein BCR32DRAFT_329773 [Anaeromyces robustus]